MISLDIMVNLPIDRDGCKGFFPLHTVFHLFVHKYSVFFRQMYQYTVQIDHFAIHLLVNLVLVDQISFHVECLSVCTNNFYELTDNKNPAKVLQPKCGQRCTRASSPVKLMDNNDGGSGKGMIGGKKLAAMTGWQQTTVTTLCYKQPITVVRMVIVAVVVETVTVVAETLAAAVAAAALPQCNIRGRLYQQPLPPKFPPPLPSYGC